jgi:putative DNA primase/helicase
MADTKKAFHEQVAEKLIEQLRQGTAPWQRPWEAGEAASLLPINPTTGKRYRGINAIQLMSQGRVDQRWLTYKQAAAAGAQVRKGEHGTAIQYWKFSEEQTPHRRERQARPRCPGQAGQSGSAAGAAAGVLRHRLQRRADRRPAADATQGTDLGRRRARRSHPAGVRRRDPARGAEPRLLPLADRQHPPSRQGPVSQRRQLLRDRTARTRALDWPPIAPGPRPGASFGSEGYAKEELRAEIASMILGDELGIGHDPGQHAAYVGTWINVLRDDPLEIFRAAADAEKIHGYVLALEQQQVQEQTSQQAQTQDSAQNQGSAENHDNTENQEAAMKSFTQTPVLASAALNSTDGEAAVADPRLDPINPHEQAARLARIEEERVRRDPNSTDEDIAAAREARKSADVAALLNDKDLQRQIAEHEREQQTTQAGQVDQASQSSKIWIDVPYPQKDEAKALGARWDRQEQSWYVPAGVDPAPFARWTPAAAPQARPKQSPATPPRQYLAVPYGERVAAKAAGAVWDKAAKSWYAGPKADLAKLKRWKPENVPTQQGPAMTPRDEFAEALRSIGCVVSGDHPIMDGQKHRISVEGEKHSEKSGSGFYVGHLDGHPAGYMKNNKIGIDLKWKSKGYTFEPEQKARMLAEAAEKLQARTAEQERLHEQTAQRVARQMAKLLPVIEPTAYMNAKGIEPQPGVFTDREGQKTYIPATDVDGKQWTMQYIREDGSKRFAKDSRKEVCFHAIGGLDALAKAPVLVIGEGYATAGSLSQTLGFATVAAFDSGNLVPVAKALHEKYPDKPIVIAGDDDKHLEATQGVNPGRSKAEEAARAVGGKLLLPIFAPGEQAANPKGFTDFNDLATKSVLGQEGIARQVRSVVDDVIEWQRGRSVEGRARGERQEQAVRRVAKVG